MEIWVRLDSKLWEDYVQQGWTTHRLEVTDGVSWALMRRVLREW